MSMRPYTITDLEHLDERAQDLFVERTLWGLDASQERELSAAVSDADGLGYEFERAVGALAVGMSASEHEMLPASLGLKLAGLASSGEFLGGAASRRPSADGVHPLGSRDAALGLGTQAGDSISFPAESVAGTVKTRAGAVQWTGWLAAAACSTYAAFVSTPGGTADGRQVAGLGTMPERLVAFQETAQDLMRAGWAGVSAIGASDHGLDRGVSGEVIWSDSLDEGFMTISGIEPNDPDEFQYQLWIFDAERPAGALPQFRADGLPELLTQMPVDGGVFDVPSGGAALDEQGRVIVPIDAKLPVGRGVIFAVTKERPGGVVVSDREIVFLALRG